MSNLIFDFHYGDEAEQYTFYRIPKSLFTNPHLKILSTDSKLLYGLMLDRMSLSRKNNWLDNGNKVYIFFTHEDIQDFLECASGKSTRLLGELEKAGLIYRERQGQGRPTKIYVKRYLKSQKQTCEKEESKREKEPKVPSKEKFSMKPTPVSSEIGVNSEELQSQTLQNRKSRLAITESLDFPKSKGNDTKSSNTESSNLSINLYDEEMMDGMIEEKKEQISYDYFCHDRPMEKTATMEIVTILAEVELGTQKTYSINGSPVSAGLVKKQLSQIDHGHIEYVLECLDSLTTPITNIRAYLIASLYNSIGSIALYYQQRCLADGVV